MKAKFISRAKDWTHSGMNRRCKKREAVFQIKRQKEDKNNAGEERSKKKERTFHSYSGDIETEWKSWGRFAATITLLTTGKGDWRDIKGKVGEKNLNLPEGSTSGRMDLGKHRRQPETRRKKKGKDQSWIHSFFKGGA